MRQPVIEYVLLAPLIVTVRSIRPGRSVAKHVAFRAAETPTSHRSRRLITARFESITTSASASSSARL